MSSYPRETLAQAGYKHVRTLAPGVHALQEVDSQKIEVWYASQFYAGYAIIYLDTMLEFGYTMK